MVLEQTQGSVALEEAPVCRHHWVIEPANGRYSQGECLNCHEVRAFENSLYSSGDNEEEQS